MISGVAYALRVEHSDRAEFEKRYGWVIKKMDSGDHSSVRNEYMPENLDPAPINPEYAPVILSQESVSHILSIDMMSGKVSKKNIARTHHSDLLLNCLTLILVCRKTVKIFSEHGPPARVF